MLIKISIVIIAFSFICYKITNHSEIALPDFITMITDNNILSIKNAFILLALSSCNWVLETIKWKNLVSPVKSIHVKDAFEQSLGALTASLFTPNRIGEYGAKAMYYPFDLRKRVLLINLIGNLLQMGVTLFLGCIGLSFYLSKYKLGTSNLVLFIVISLCVMTFVLLFVYKGKLRIKGFSLEKMRQFLSDYPIENVFKGLILSFLRYAVFSFQFYVLLLLFQINISYFQAMTVITSMYLIASVIPSVFIFDVVIKGSVAVYLFSFLGINNLSILSITTLMWLLNFVLPSIIGSYFVLNFKLAKNAAQQ